MAEPSPGSWRHRAARLGWSATALAVVAMLVLGAGVWAFISEKPSPGSDSELLFDDPRWQLWLTAAGAAWVVAAYVGVAALETAAAMRVLVPGPPAAEARPHVLRVGLDGCGSPGRGLGDVHPGVARVGACAGRRRGADRAVHRAAPRVQRGARPRRRAALPAGADPTTGPGDRHRRQLHRHHGPDRSGARASRSSRPSATPRRRPAR